MERRREEVGPSEKKVEGELFFFRKLFVSHLHTSKTRKRGKRRKKSGKHFFPFPPEWEARGGKGEEVEVEASNRIQTISAVSAVSRRKL